MWVCQEDKMAASYRDACDTSGKGFRKILLRLVPQAVWLSLVLLSVVPFVESSLPLFSEVSSSQSKE